MISSVCQYCWASSLADPRWRSFTSSPPPPHHHNCAAASLGTRSMHPCHLPLPAASPLTAAVAGASSRSLRRGPAPPRAASRQQKQEQLNALMAAKADELRARLTEAVKAEREEQLAAEAAAYAGSSLPRLQREGVVLTGLRAAPGRRLFSEFLWVFSMPPDPAGPPSTSGSRQGYRTQDSSQGKESQARPPAQASITSSSNSRARGRSAAVLERGGPRFLQQQQRQRQQGSGGEERELPYHRFERGQSVRISSSGLLRSVRGTASDDELGSSDDEGCGSSSSSSASTRSSSSPTGLPPSVEGTVAEVGRGRLVVAVTVQASQALAECGPGAVFRIDRSQPDATTRRQLAALRRLAWLPVSDLSRPDEAGQRRIRALLLGAPGAPALASQAPEWASHPDWREGFRRGLEALKDGSPAQAGSAAGSGQGGGSLNQSQLTAVAKAAVSSLTLWQGPPGTGKTRTLLAFLGLVCSITAGNRQLRRTLGPILAVADTNAAADNLLEGLLARGISAVRVGAPARVRPELRGACVDALAEGTGDGQLAAQMRDRAEELMQPPPRPAPSLHMDAATADAFWQEQWQIRCRQAREAWRRADDLVLQAADSLLSQAQVVVATCTGSGEPRLAERTYRLVVVDEASQATEPSSLVAILKGAECVLMAGDSKQLPPTVTSARAERLGLSMPLFNRLTAQGVPSLLLSVQYRMHPALAEFSSQQFYAGKVVSGVTEQERPLITGLPWPRPDCPVLLVPVAGQEKRARSKGVGPADSSSSSSSSSSRDGDGASYQNEDEAKAVLQVLLRAAEDPSVSSCALLTPYAGQARLLTALLRKAAEQAAQRAGTAGAAAGDGAASGQQQAQQQQHGAGSAVAPPASLLSRVVVSTVDGYQGREADLIIFSAVRSNSQCKLGFLSDARRLNVAITRPRRGLVVVCNPGTLSHDPNWAAWLEWVAHKSGQTSKAGSGQQSGTRKVQQQQQHRQAAGSVRQSS